MGRKKTAVRKKGGHKAVNMLRALILNRQGASIRKAARESNVLYGTLQRYIKKYANISTENLKNQRLTPHYNVNMIFTAEQEAELTAYIKECGATKALTTKDIRKAAYELAAVNDIEAPEGWRREKMAGIEWLRSFKERNFGVKKPEVTDENAVEMEAVMKELTKGNQVESLNEALKTLEVTVDREKAGDSNVNMEEDSSNRLTDKLKMRADFLPDDQELFVILENDTCNALEEENLDSLLKEEQKSPAGAAKDIDGAEVWLEAGCSQDPFSDAEGEDDNANTSIWSFYERVPKGRARCVVCRAVIARADLKAHLKSKHPKLMAEGDVSSEEEASDSQENVYTEIVYLDDEQIDKKVNNTPIKRKSKSTIERPRKRQPSSSSDEIPLRQKKTRIAEEKPDNNDEIEQFAKYVTCLLRKIPPAACMELQAEIVNLILKKQLELKKNETSLLAGTDKMVEIKISDVCRNAPSTSLNTSIETNGFSNESENKG